MLYRRGFDVPELRGVNGRRINYFWANYHRRKVDAKLAFLEYVPVMLYSMSGVSPDVPYEKRVAATEDVEMKAKDALFGQLNSIPVLKRKLEKQIQRLGVKVEELDRLEAMDNDDRFVSKWLTGEV